MFNSYFYTKKKYEDTNYILYANPIVFRAISGTFHNMIANKLWLLSNSISEGRFDSNAVDKTSFVSASRTIIIMDPYFTGPTSYAATYIVSIKKDLPIAIELLHMAGSIDKNNFTYLFNELMMLLTYGIDYDYAVDYEYIRTMAKKIEALPDSQKMIGRLNMNDWVEDLLVFSNDKLNRHQQAIDDLEWLYKNTENEQRKKDIINRIQSLKAM